MTESQREEKLNDFLETAYQQKMAGDSWFNLCVTVSRNTMLSLFEAKLKYHEVAKHGEWEDIKFDLVRDFNEAHTMGEATA